jgi:hypothetical protein
MSVYGTSWNVVCNYYRDFPYKQKKKLGTERICDIVKVTCHNTTY